MVWSGKGKVAVVGVASSRFGRHIEEPLGKLTLDTCRAALADAGVEASQIDGLATYPSPAEGGAPVIEGVNAVRIDYMLRHFPVAPEVRWYGEHSEGLIVSTVIDAAAALIAGMAHYVLVWRALYRNPGTFGEGARSARPGGISQFSVPYGIQAWYQTHSLAYRRYMHLYGATREEMATLCVSQRYNAGLNESAYFRDVPMSREDYMNTRWISEPLCLFDCDVPVTGAIAMVMTTAERARDLPGKAAYIAAGAQQTSPNVSPFFYTLGNYAEVGRTLTDQLWSDSGLAPKDVNAAMLYDGFSPSVYYWLETAGFCKRGEGHAFIQDGRIELRGELPINTNGGSLSEGRMHGAGHLAEAVRQVLGRGGARQVANCNVSLVVEPSPMQRSAGMLFTSEP